MSEARSIINPETDRNLLIGIFCGLIGYTALPIGDGMAKIIGMDGYSGLQIAWGRYVFHVLALLPFALIKFSPRELIPKRPLFQTFRASFIIACTFLFFTSLKEVPLADALALIFVAPLVVTGLSGPILGEKVGLHRWMAVFFGFVGAVIIIQPGEGMFQWSALYALATGVFYGLYILITRLSANENHGLVNNFYMAVVGVIVLSLFVPFNWKELTPITIGYLAATGVAAAIGHGMIIAATSRMEANTLAPVQYYELLVGAIVGYFMFGDVPAMTTWFGAFIIVISGLYIGYRENQKNKRAKQNLIEKTPDPSR
ncbi:MAG: DMT family transporter [Alphaproteobacteria bacterium]|nr:DMT family transporter [Alphaproteobacteria bacterium]